MSHSIRFALPLTLTLLLIAALACGVTVTQTRIDNARLFTDPEGVTGTRSYARDSIFYARADLRHASEDTVIEAVWRAVDVGADHAAYEIARESMEPHDGPLAFELVPPAEGWIPGDYALVYMVDGRQKLTVEFTVKGKRE